MDDAEIDFIIEEEAPHSLTVFCGREFWNASTAWESDLPDVGLCMERTVLLWIPCLLLWILSPLYLVSLQGKGFLYMPWSRLLIIKIILSSILILTATAELIWAIVLSSQGTLLPGNEYLAPVLLLLTYGFHTLLVLIGRRHGERNSSLIYLFWLLMVVCGLPQMFTTITYTINQDDRLHILMVVTFLIQYCGALILFGVNCVADDRPQSTTFSDSKNKMPLRNASFASKVTFHWANAVVWKGYKTVVTPDDIWDLPSKLSADHLDKKWEEAWRKEYTRMQVKASKEDSNTPFKISVMRVLLRRFFWSAFFTSVLYFIAESLTFASPRLLSLLIQFTTDLNEPSWHGYFYALLLLCVTLTNTFLKNLVFFLTQLIATQIRSSIMNAVYRKALTLSNTSRRESTTGEIVNLMAIDSQRLGDSIIYLNISSIAPIIITIAITELWKLLGPSVLSGLFVLILLVPANSVISNKIKMLQTAHMKYKDKRIKLVTEIISGIKVLKLYAWEYSFAKQVDVIRREEVRIMKESAYYQAMSSFLFNTTPYLVALVIFTTYVLTSEENILTAENAFVTLSLINIMDLPMIMLPTTIAQCIQAHVSLKRMGKYLNSSDIDEDAVTQDKEESSAILVKGGQFTWGTIENEEPWTLKNADMEVAPKSLVAVVGSVGAGKSSLVSALLGEMQKDNGKVVINGKVAYVSQQAWLQNATLKENIIWGEDFDAAKYYKIIDACALQPDLDMLPGGDMTEVGEKGLNLSGGQKQRISLARAAYSNADILIMDDPLSAVDSHVGKHIFQNLIGPKGLMNDKTRVLVTHAIWVLPQMNEIFVMQDGSIVERGTYNQLLSKGGNFAQFLLQHINDKSEDDKDDDELNEICDLLEETPIGKVLLRQVSRQSSRTEEGRHSSMRQSRTISTESSNYPSECDSKPYGSTKSLSTSNLTLNGTVPEVMQEDNLHILVQKEKAETGKVKMQVYHFYAKSMGLLSAIMPFIFFAIAQASKAGSNVWLSQYSTPIDSTSNQTNEEFDRVGFLSGYGGFGIGQCFFFFLGSLATWTGALLASKHIHWNLLENILHLPMSFFDTNPSGRIMNRMSKEIDILDSVLPVFLNGFGSSAAKVTTTMVVIIASTPMVAITIIPLLGLYYFVQNVYISAARQIKRIESLAKSPIFSFFSETLQGVSIIRAFKKQGDFIVTCRGKVDKAIMAFVTNLATNRWLLVRLESLGNLITFSAAIFAVAGRGTIDPAIVGLSITYALEVTFILNAMIRNAAEIEANIVSVERIQEYIKEEQEAPWTIKDHKPSKLWPDKGIIAFNKYKARYRPGLELVVKGISCAVKSGEKVGIVGRTGAGKSSLTLGLFRIIEAAGGSIEIDGINISKIGLHDLRGQLSIIPQDPVLFSGTLRMNVDPFDKYSDADVWNALEHAHLKDYIKSQTNALQTTIDEGGANLSVGQRQLVCLARALLRKSKVLVLDEATAAVDLDTDDLIQKTIRTEFAECTILTIAHRLNNIMDSDRVMVLDKGLIAEFSTPTELLSNKDSIFYGMAQDAGLT